MFVKRLKEYRLNCSARTSGRLDAKVESKGILSLMQTMVIYHINYVSRCSCNKLTANESWCHSVNKPILRYICWTDCCSLL
uniref:Uncharacterized protein n=1 Tax=Oryza brachyantha TaxID=4533 RepID=J3LWS9_ORYBR